MVVKASEGSGLRVLIGGKSELRAPKFGSTNKGSNTEDAQKGETWWRDSKINRLAEVAREASNEISSAFKVRLSEIRGDIPILFQERQLRGDQEYLSLKRSDPSSVQNIRGLGIGIIRRFELTVSEEFRAAISNNFGNYMEALVLANRLAEISMPSAAADGSVDKFAGNIEEGISQVKNAVIGMIAISSCAAEFGDVISFLSAQSGSISDNIILSTETLKSAPTGPKCRWFL